MMCDCDGVMLLLNVTIGQTEGQMNGGGVAGPQYSAC